MGDGAPVVILEAGRNNGAGAWRAVMPLLTRHVRVVAYDRAGIGGSDPAPDPAIVARQVSDLASLITELNAAPCVLAGHSWGGVLVQLLAFRHPGLVAGLILVDPADERMAGALPRLMRWGIRAARLHRNDELTGGDTAANAAALRELRDSPRPFLDIPVVVLSASRGFPRRFRLRWTGWQAELAATTSEGRHVVVQGSGHNIPADRPDVVADAIMRVVAQVRERTDLSALRI